MFLHTFSPQPILAHIGRITIHWYGLLLSLGSVAGFIVFRRLGQKYGLKVTDLEVLFFWIIFIGLIGARLYHVTNEWGYYVSHPSEIFSIWNGGLAIHGAMIAGLLVLLFYSRAKKISLWLLTDITVPALAIGQAIGRWGNYFNQELFGRPTSQPWGIPIEPLNRPLELIGFKYFHPTFLYESLGSIAVFIVLMLLHRKILSGNQSHRAQHIGLVTLVYFIAESVIRAATEWFRVDRVPTIADVRLPFLVSLAIAGTAAVLLFRRLKVKSV